MVDATAVPTPLFSSTVKHPTTVALLGQSSTNTGASFSSVTSTRTMAVSVSDPAPSSVVVTSNEYDRTAS